MANKRKKQLVRRDIQLALVRRLLLQWVLFIFATFVVTVIFQYMMDPLQDKAVMLTRIKITAGAMVIVSFFLAPLFIRDSIKLSLRVVGPIVRLRSAMEQTAPDIENPRIQLRDNDFWKDVAVTYNDMLARIEQPSETKA